MKMFVRLKKHPGSKHHSVLICENYREGKKINQKIISFLGASADPEKLMALQEEGRVFIEQVKAARAAPEIPSDPAQTMSLHTYEVTRKNVGIRDTLGALYDELGFNHILTGRKISKVLKSVVLTRFAEPASKRKTCSILERRFNEEISSDAIYYMMDQLAKNLSTSQRIVFNATQEATGSTVDVALFDVTTLHLETTIQDELRNFGYSKNNRRDTTQVTLALATTKSGMPIGYRLFPGNTAEVSTLMESINSWRKVIAIRDIIIVGDRAMMSQENLLQLRMAGLKYIIAYPMKKASKNLKETILNRMDYKESMINHEAYLKQEIKLNDEERLIVTFNAKRRAKDAKTREKLIAKLRNKLGVTKNAKQLVSNRGYLKFTEIDKEVQAQINEEKVAEDAKWDGLHGILSNTDLSGEECVERYKNLWVIEEAFRINKHSLKMRPIYHYTPDRIRAHIEICFLTFALIKHAQHRLKQGGVRISVDELREELSPLEASILCDRKTGKFYRMPAQMSFQAKEIYKILGREKDLAVQYIDQQELPPNINQLS
ncbi:MAG: IS1634 family transposase [Bacteroidota bacterium]